MEQALLALGLVIASVQDIREKRIWLPVLWGITAALMLLRYCRHSGGILGLLCAPAFILLFLLLHRLSRGQIGVGDAFLFGMTGAGLGWRKNLLLLYMTFFLVFFVALYFVVVKKKSRTYEMPLSPFVLASYLVLL